MKIFLCPDSFKGTMSSEKICDIVTKAIKSVEKDADIVAAPVADGGEGTVDTFLYALGGNKVFLSVKGPLGNEVSSFYGILKDGKTAIVEMAAASGLPLAENNKNPLITSTYGTGQLIYDAIINKGCTDLIIGIGGSATNDAGIGAATALGAVITDKSGYQLEPIGRSLNFIDKIDLSRIDSKIFKTNITVACDVTNPLYGPNGAAYVYGPQKGADKEAIGLLDNGLRNFASVVKKDLNIEVDQIPGGGAAGGLGAGLFAFFNANLKRGIDIVLDIIDFNRIVKDIDLIITGEGRIDSQSLYGKVPYGVAIRAKKHGVPVVVIAGDIDGDMSALYKTGITSVFTTNRKAMAFKDLQKNAEQYLYDTAVDVIRLFMFSQSLL